jgi:uncharacterized protein (TIGR03435 family)
MSLSEKAPQLLFAWCFFQRRFAAILIMTIGAGIASGQRPAKESLRFDVASVRMSQPGTPMRTNFGLDSFEDTGRLNGLFSANTYLKEYIRFAYRLPSYEEQELLLEEGSRRWADTTISIEARAEGHPTKSEVRVMVRNLLEERMHLRMRSESRELPVYALAFAEAGKPGPGLRPHTLGNCEQRTAPQIGETTKQQSAHHFCGDASWQDGDFYHIEMVDTTLGHLVDFLNDYMPFRGGSRQLIVDGSDDARHYDLSFTFHRIEETEGQGQASLFGEAMVEAVKKQLGLKFEKETRAVPLLAIEHVEKPTEN